MSYEFLNRHEFDQHIEDVRRLRFPSPLDSSGPVEEIIFVKLTGSTTAGCSVADAYYLNGTPAWIGTGRQVLVLKTDLTAPTSPTTVVYRAKYVGMRSDGSQFWGVYVIIDSTGTTLPTCPGCQCPSFVNPPTVKMTVALSFELADYTILPFTSTTTTYTSVFSPIATSESIGCAEGAPAVSHMPSPMSYHNGGAYNMDTALNIISPGMAICNVTVDRLTAFPFAFDFGVTYTFRSTTFTDHFAGSSISSVATSCNPDGTWVVTFTGYANWDHSATYNFFVSAVATFTVEPII